MTRYQLAKLVQWAGKLQTRKRMQKVVFLLQAKGLPLEAEYSLHHFGPYSQDVAHLTDQMAQVGLLTEEEKQNSFGNTYDYQVSEKTERMIAGYEATPEGKQQAAALGTYETLAKRLLTADLKDLEHAATIVYFRKKQHDWPAAVDKAATFKKLRKNSSALRRAEALAREILK